jgi:hypothetical protein
MFFSAVTDAVRDRLLADTGSGKLVGTGGILAGGIANTIPVAGSQAYPVAIISAELPANQSAFVRGMFDVAISVTVYGNHQTQIPAMWNAVDRIFGDWFATNPPATTRGLHGWNMGTLTVSGFTVNGSQLILVSTSPIQLIDDDKASITTTYKATLSVGA